MIDAYTVAAAMGMPCMTSGEMQEALQLWDDIYRGRVSWCKNRVRPIGLPVAVTREIKRLILTEFSASVDDATADRQLQQFVPQLRRGLDYGLATGGMLLKPCYMSGGVVVDIVPQTAYVPVDYTDGTCTGVICPEEVAIGKNYYTRLEAHTYNRQDMTHTIRQKCYKSSMPGQLGLECSLQDVPQWAGITPTKVFDNVASPLFSVFRVPDANNVDPVSPLGVSVYADAAGFFKDADEQWERIMWEMESSERAINASIDLFRLKNGKPELPKGRERMYMVMQQPDNKTFFQAFSPEVRDSSYFNTLNQILRRIESAVGLSYGTLSEVSDVEKTAEEIAASKQRSFVRVSDLQEALRTALEGLVYGIQYYNAYYSDNLSFSAAPLSCSFGDGIKEDSDKEYQRRVQMVRDKLLRPELFLAWYFGCTEEETLEMLPQQQDDGGLFGGSLT